MTLLFFALCILLLTMPFVPAYREWLSPEDCAPLPISRTYANEIDYFADQFREKALAEMPLIDDSALRNFELVCDPPGKMDWLAPTRPLIAQQPINLQFAVRCQQPLYAMSSISCTRDSSFSSVFSDGDIELGPYSEILDWAHAEGAIKLDIACIALRRLSSKVAIDLAAQCCFERVHAPVIRFGTMPADTPPLESPGAFSADIDMLPGAIRRTPNLHMVKGDCSLPPGRIFKGSLVVTGRLIIGNYTTIIGDIKAREGTIIGTGVRIIGSLTCEDRIYILDHVEIAGPLISETDIVLGAGTVIGRLDAPTTVSAENIIAKSGAAVHGALWARNVGVVWAP